MSAADEPSAVSAAAPAPAIVPASPVARGAAPPTSVAILDEKGRRDIVRAFLAQRTTSYRVGIGVKLVVRLALIFGPSRFFDLPLSATSFITLFVAVWILFDLFRTPFPRAMHRAKLPFNMNAKVGAFLGARAKEHGPLDAAALEEALVVDLGARP